MRDSILAAPIVLDLALFLDLAKRSGFAASRSGSDSVQTPMAAEGLTPDHDLCVQLIKLKNTLRWMVGDDVNTHLGHECHD